MFAAVIPQGPLHPGDALWALGAGLTVAVMFRRYRLWLPAVVVAMVAVIVRRHGFAVFASYDDRPDTIAAVAVTVGGAVLGIAIPPPRLIVTGGAVLIACGLVWGLVPDTEVPLISGVVLAAALIGAPWQVRRRMTGLLLAVPVVASVIGSVGRPDTFDRSVAAGAMAMIVVVGGSMISARLRQRAGTPSTVAPAAMSSTTTAPAATIAP